MRPRQHRAVWAHLHDGFLDFAMRAHAEVVIAAPDSDAFLVSGVIVRQRRLFGKARHFLEDAIRVVLLLAHYLLVEELAIFESCAQIKAVPWVSEERDVRIREDCC